MIWAGGLSEIGSEILGWLGRLLPDVEVEQLLVVGSAGISQHSEHHVGRTVSYLISLRAHS